MGRIELQPAVMHLHDGADERQTKTGSRLGAAGVEAHEALDHIENGFDGVKEKNLIPLIEWLNSR